MAKYHFEIVDGFRLEDPVGQDCPDDGQAKQVANKIARQIAEDLVHDDVDGHQDRKVVVLDDHGDEVYHTSIKR